MRRGYARLVSHEDDVVEQVAGLKAEGCEEVLIEREASPSARQRLDQFLYDLSPGDELVTTSFETLGRSTGKLVVILHDLLAKKVAVRVLAPSRLILGAGEPISDFDLLAVLQRHETERMTERYRSGAGHNVRKRALTQAEAAEALARLGDGQSIAAVARDLGVDKGAVSQALSGRRKLGESLHAAPGRAPRAWRTSLSVRPAFELSRFTPSTGDEDG